MTKIEPSQAQPYPSAQSIPPGTYVADPDGSQLRFRAKAFGLTWVRGQMPAIGGTVHVAAGRLSGNGEVAASRLSTGLAPRDWHLRTSHYLHTTRHPRIQMSVEDADIASGRAKFRVVVRGRSAEVSLDLDSVQVTNETLRLEAHGTIDRSPFRMLPPWCGVSRLVHVELTVVAELVTTPPMRLTPASMSGATDESATPPVRLTPAQPSGATDESG
jgi:polyisoprenoid-binding protein YceI